MEPIELPVKVRRLLEKLNPPRRLIRHLRIVHSVASEIVDDKKKEWPELDLKIEDILTGAATHDIGKIEFPEELYEKGKRHEQAGMLLLSNHGFKQEVARFAITHGSDNWEELEIEDLIVIVSDKIWKGKRINELEEQLALKLSSLMNIDFWEVYSKLDIILTKISSGADKRIIWQAE